MSLKKLILATTFVATAAVLTACSSSPQITKAGSNVQFVDTKPTNCQFIGKAEGRVGTFFSGNKTHSELMRSAAADLLNKAAAMGGNVIYNAQDASMRYVSAVAPTDAVMDGDVYKCQ